MGIEFIDLKAQQRRLKPEIDARIAKVLAEGRYILGPEVGEFEVELAQFGGAARAVSCANGTDALVLSMMAWGIGAGDAVFCPSFTFCATAETIALTGAVPVFVDIDRDTYNLDPASLKQAISDVKAEGVLTPRAVIVVDLFGQCADYPALAPIARENGLKVIADSAQGFGSTLDGKHPLHWSDVTTTSFFPAKPLGCYGDGGAVLTNDDALADHLMSIRVHGQGGDKYDNIRIGLNSRLDTLQAAVLLVKLSVFAEEIKMRNKVAARYIDGLRNHALRLPNVLPGIVSTWAQFTIEVADPDGFAAALHAEGIPTARYYPCPVHLQTAYTDYPCASDGLVNTLSCMGNVISLPMSADLSEVVQDKVIEAAKATLVA